MNADQLKYYLDHQGMRCPYCKSKHIRTVGPLESDAAIAWQDVKCHICNKLWVDQFMLVHAEENTA